MAQSLFAGGTCYKNQSLNDIREDIATWRRDSETIKKKFLEITEELKESQYWKKRVLQEFHWFCNSVIQTCDTFEGDFKIVLEAIDKNKITKRELSILDNVYEVAKKKEQDASRIYKTNSNRWHKYGDDEFEKVEYLYVEGRGYFLTLLDAGPAIARLEDYAREEPVVNQNIHAKNSVIIGDGNCFDSSNINVNKEMEDSKSIGKWLMENLWIPILVGLIIWFITEQVLK